MFSCLGKEKEEKEENEDWRDYSCDICGKELATKIGLKRPRAYHSKPCFPPQSFLCDYPKCDRGFDTIQALNLHKRAHVARDARSQSRVSS